MGHTEVKQNILFISPVCFSIFSVPTRIFKITRVVHTALPGTLVLGKPAKQRKRPRRLLLPPGGPAAGDGVGCSDSPRSSHGAGLSSPSCPQTPNSGGDGSPARAVQDARDMGAQNGSLQTGSLRINNDINLEAV